MNKEQMCDEIEILETVLTCNSDNPELAHRIGMLAMTLGDWQKATGIFTKYVKTEYQPILRDLGVVLCKVHAKNPTGPEYRQGQKYLELASSPPYQDADALASLAGTWKALNKKKYVTCIVRLLMSIHPTRMPLAIIWYMRLHTGRT